MSSQSVSTAYCMNCSQGYDTDDDRCPDCRSEGIPCGPKVAYHRIKSALREMQAKENPTDSAVILHERELRTSLCDSGILPVDRYESAAKMLMRNNVAAFGPRYAAAPESEADAREAIEYAVGDETPDRAFIGAMNTLLSEGAFDA